MKKLPQRNYQDTSFVFHSANLLRSTTLTKETQRQSTMNQLLYAAIGEGLGKVILLFSIMMIR